MSDAANGSDRIPDLKEKLKYLIKIRDGDRADLFYLEL